MHASLSPDVSKIIGCLLRTHSSTDCKETHFCCKCWLHLLDIWHCLSDSDDICDPKYTLKCPRNF